MDSLPRELEITMTEDGSPTICFSHASGQEKMHNSKGALSESLYIYGVGLERLMEAETVQPRVISVGLGLGYCEMIAFALAIKANRALTLWSFESFAFLSESLRMWLANEATALNPSYEAILNGVSRETGVEGAKIKSQMAMGLRDGNWQTRGEFPHDLKGVADVNGVLFDAFSSKTSPQLWNEETLKSVFEKILSEDAVFVTYAATGSLHRALNFLNFKLEDRAGFGGKRQSTFAKRGCYAIA